MTPGFRRILHVCGAMKPGGITRFVESLVALNPAFRTRHDLLTTFAGGPEPRAGDYTHHRLELGRRGVAACLRMARGIYRQYDAVMIHGAHPAVVFPLIGLGRNVFVFQHGMAVSSGSAARRTMKKAWFSILPWLLDADTICSTGFARAKSEALGIKFRSARTHIVTFGTDMLPPAAVPPRTGGTLTIGVAGRLDAQKRQHLVLESFLGYAGERTVRILVAGEGPERARLERLAETLGDRVHVTFLGTITEMERFYDQLDLFVFPSGGESFGLVALEAMVRCVPVVVFEDVGGCLPLVRPGETGFVVSGGSEGLKALWGHLDRPDLLADLRSRMRHLDWSPFSVRETRAALDRLAGAPADV